MSKLGLGPFGVALNVSATYLDEAAEAERLGYSSIWLPGGQIDRLGRLAEVVRATEHAVVASAVISLDVYPPGGVAELYGQVEAGAPARLLVGLGGPQKPQAMRALNAYLDHLDGGQPVVPAERRMLAALGPKKLQPARDRCAGAIMLLVTPAYTAAARRILTGRRALVVDQMLVLDTDAVRARRVARGPLRRLSGLRGYRASFARMGFSDADIDGLGDGLVDQLVAWGDVDTVTGRIGEHLRAGADQVVLHVLSEGDQPGPIEVARRLARRLPRRDRHPTDGSS